MQDAFPHEDVVWGQHPPSFVHIVSCNAFNPGIAYTIDPAYESEVRDYLGIGQFLDLMIWILTCYCVPRLSGKGSLLAQIILAC